MWESIAPILGKEITTKLVKKGIDALFAKLFHSKKGPGQIADLLDELKTNASICRLVAECDADPLKSAKRLSRKVYLDFRRHDFDFLTIKKGEIPPYHSIANTDVAFLIGRTLPQALGNVSDRVLEIQTISETSGQLTHTDLTRRFANLSRRLAVVIRFISE